MSDERAILDEQILYYRARAPEYDEWVNREGRYDRGEAHRKRWLREMAQVTRALAACEPGPDILELACGTGNWTRHLVHSANRVTAVDASPEALRINARRVNSSAVTRVQADLFEWRPPRAFDFIFFGFWLSHVPPSRFDEFWHGLRNVLKPQGRVFFVDSRLTPASTALDHAPPGTTGMADRVLNDGRTFQVVKVFYEPTELETRLRSLGWQARVHTTREFFLYASLAPAESPRLRHLRTGRHQRRPAIHRGG